jgi:hypothetical protein
MIMRVMGCWCVDKSIIYKYSTSLAKENNPRFKNNFKDNLLSDEPEPIASKCMSKISKNVQSSILTHFQYSKSSTKKNSH